MGKILSGSIEKAESNTDFLKRKMRKKPSAKIRYRLQKEVNSKCPFCDDQDVEYFDVHHIDEDSSNTVEHNLILICKKCHAKIGEGKITKEQVVEKKTNLTGAAANIEIYKINIISKNNCWKPFINTKNAFQLDWKKANDFPTFQFHILNNYDKTIVLSDIELKAKYLFSGFGDLPQPCEVPDSSVYHLIIKGGQEIHSIEKFKGVQIPSKQAFILNVEVFEQFKSERFNLENRMILYFTLKFSNNIVVNLSKILLNTENENEGVPIQVLS
jgi:hypothetical protein